MTQPSLSSLDHFLPPAVRDVFPDWSGVLVTPQTGPAYWIVRTAAEGEELAKEVQEPIRVLDETAGRLLSLLINPAPRMVPVPTPPIQEAVAWLAQHLAHGPQRINALVAAYVGTEMQGKRAEQRLAALGHARHMLGVVAYVGADACLWWRIGK